MNRRAIRTIGVITGVSLGASIYTNLNKKRKDKLARDLMREIAKVIQPTTVGLLSEQAFDIHFTDAVISQVSGKVITLKPEAAVNSAKEIRSAWSWFGDDELKVYGVFRNLKDKVQVSQVAKAYQSTYMENLIDKLHEKLDKKEIEKVLDIVRALPTYRTIS